MNPSIPALLAPPSGPLSSSWVLAHADRGLLARVLSEKRVELTPARPKAAEYFEAWSEAFARWLGRMIDSHEDLWQGLSWGLQLAAWMLIAAMIGLAVILSLRLLQRRRSSEAAPSPAGIRLGRPLEPLRNAVAWRAEFERLLTTGDVEKALEALWWWFANSIAREIDPSWTSRQLLLAARRTDLTPAALELDRAIYGPHRPRVEDLSALLGRLQGSIA